MMKYSSILLAISLSISSVFAQKSNISFRKVPLDSTYVSEAACTADIDKDGLIDIVAGDVWYKAPNWSRHQIRPLGLYYGVVPKPTLPRGSGASYYARSIANFVADIDADGWLDVITMNSQGAPAYWYRNPAGKYNQLWDEYLAIEEFHNESPQMLDLFGTGQKVIVAGNKIAPNKYTLSWFSVPADPTKPWQPHVIGHPDILPYSVKYQNTINFAPGGMGHGLGLADMNADGHPDVLTSKGWYQGQANGKTTENWPFHAFPLDSLADAQGPGLTFAHMYGADFDHDGDMDIIGSSAHRYGLWWFENQKKGNEASFVKHEISMKYSQLHSMTIADFDHDGQPEYVAAKRYLAHLGRDPGEFDPAVIIYTHQEKNGEFTTHVIDDNSAAGTQIWLDDLNADGKTDIITSNKKGTRIFYME
jgi:hypothetical protein